MQKQKVSNMPEVAMSQEDDFEWVADAQKIS